MRGLSEVFGSEFLRARVPGGWSGVRSQPCLPDSLPLTFTGKVLDGHVLDRNLLEEKGLLASGVPADDAALPQPPSKPGHVAVAVERVRQEVSEGERASEWSSSTLTLAQSLGSTPVAQVCSL